MAAVLNRIRDSIRQNRVCYFLAAFLMIAGIAAGVITLNGLDEWLKESIRENVFTLTAAAKGSTINFFDAMTYVMFKDILPLALFALCSLFMLASPLLAVTLLLKGFIVGFSFGIICMTNGLLSIPSVLNWFIALPLMLYMCMTVVAGYVQRIKNKHFKLKGEHSAVLREYLTVALPVYFILVTINTITLLITKAVVELI